MDNFLPFCPPRPAPKPQKSKFWKKEKNTWRYIILHTCTINYDQMMYGSWNMLRDRCNWHFSFWAIFYTFTPLTAPKIKILKKWNKRLEISSFYVSVPKIMTRWCTVPKICCTMDRQTDRRMEEQKKWHIEVGALSKNQKTQYIGSHKAPLWWVTYWVNFEFLAL